MHYYNVFPNRPKVVSCVLTCNEMNYCLKKCNDTLWWGVPLLAQLAKNIQGHGSADGIVQQ